MRDGRASHACAAGSALECMWRGGPPARAPSSPHSIGHCRDLQGALGACTLAACKMSEGGRLSVGVDAILSNTTMPLNKTKVCAAAPARWRRQPRPAPAGRACAAAGAAGAQQRCSRATNAACGAPRPAGSHQRRRAGLLQVAAPVLPGQTCARLLLTALLPLPPPLCSQIICTLGPACRE